MMHRLAACAAFALLALAGCARQTARPELPPQQISRRAPADGDLYAPHLQDGGPPIPPDIGRIPEPIPVPEPKARYGNRSPYKVLGRTYHIRPSAHGYRERGQASWYGNKFHGRPTSSFEPYDMYKFTAAHKTLPLPSFVRVTNLDNGRSVVVRVNDRGPFHDGRIIDLSYAAAVKLGMHLKGVANVDVRAIDPDGEVLAADQPAASRGRRVTAPAPLHRSAYGAPAAARQTRDLRGRFYLQVASFGVKDNAHRLEDRLDGAGIDDVRVVTAHVGDRKLWRVRIGPLDDHAAADQVRGELRRLGLGEPQTVAE